MKNKQWEYAVVERLLSAAQLHAILIDKGSRNWELVSSHKAKKSVILHPGYMWHRLIFKRKKPSIPDAEFNAIHQLMK